MHGLLRMGRTGSHTQHLSKFSGDSHIRYQARRCRNAVTQYVRNKAKGELSSVKYIILTLGKGALKVFHRDEMLNTLFFRYKGKFLPVHTMKAYGKGGTALAILNIGNKWK